MTPRQLHTISQRLRSLQGRPKLPLKPETPYHVYLAPDGAEYASVTTRLNVLYEPALASWRAKVIAAYLSGKSSELADPGRRDSAIAEAAMEPERQFRAAGDLGSAIHRLAQMYLELFRVSGSYPGWQALVDGSLGETWADPSVISAVRALAAFCQERKFIPLGAELQVRDEKLRTAGTVDAVGLVDGVLTLVDWKSSNRLHGSYHLQVAAYWGLLARDARVRCPQALVVRLGKGDGRYEVEVVPNLAARFKLFRRIAPLRDELSAMEEERREVNRRPTVVLE